MFNAAALHEHGIDALTFDLLDRATRFEDIDSEEIGALTQERKIIVSEVSRFSRSASFRSQVLNAYQNRCAITGIQLKLVQAAHILPVAFEGSVDHVTNGIALSPTFHQAYDNGIIYIDEEFVLRWDHRFNSEPISPVQIDTNATGKSLPFYSNQSGKTFHLIFLIPLLFLHRYTFALP